MPIIHLPNQKIKERKRKKNGDLFENVDKHISRMSGSNSQSWSHRQNKDPYVRLAKSKGYLSRAIFKIASIDKKYNILKTSCKSNFILDLGCAPGSWIEYIIQKTKGKDVIGIDLSPLDPALDCHPNINFIMGDCTSKDIANEAILATSGNGFCLITSDISHNTIGIAKVDSLILNTIVEDILNIYVKKHLSYKGNFVFKSFGGHDFKSLIDSLKQIFKKVLTFKPQSSRSSSPEIYVVCISKLETSNFE